VKIGVIFFKRREFYLNYISGKIFGMSRKLKDFSKSPERVKIQNCFGKKPLFYGK